MKYHVEVHLFEHDKIVSLELYDAKLVKYILKGVKFEDIRIIDYWNKNPVSNRVDFKVDDNNEVMDIVNNILSGDTGVIEDQLNVLDLCGVTPVMYDGERIIGHADGQLYVFKDGEMIHKEQVKRKKYFGYGCRGTNKDGVMELEALSEEELYKFIYRQFAYDKLLQMKWFIQTDAYDDIETKAKRHPISDIKKLIMIKR